MNAGIIDKTQFWLLVTLVALSAVVPTAVAERWFLADAERERRIDSGLSRPAREGLQRSVIGVIAGGCGVRGVVLRARSARARRGTPTRLGRTQ
jgi:hypothetical protein